MNCQGLNRRINHKKTKDFTTKNTKGTKGKTNKNSVGSVFSVAKKLVKIRVNSRQKNPVILSKKTTND